MEEQEVYKQKFKTQNKNKRQVCIVMPVIQALRKLSQEYLYQFKACLVILLCTNLFRAGLSYKVILCLTNPQLKLNQIKSTLESLLWSLK